MNIATISATLTPIIKLSPQLTASIVPTVLPQSPFIFTTSDKIALVSVLITLCLGFLQIWQYFKNKADLKITVEYDFEIAGVDMTGRFANLNPGNLYWSINIVNKGTKEFFFKHLTMDYNHTNKKHLQLTESLEGQIRNFSLKPGEPHIFTIPYGLIHPSKIKRLVITDGIGKKYKKRIRYKA